MGERKKTWESSMLTELQSLDQMKRALGTVYREVTKKLGSNPRCT